MTTEERTSEPAPQDELTVASLYKGEPLGVFQPTSRKMLFRAIEKGHVRNDPVINQHPSGEFIVIHTVYGYYTIGCDIAPLKNSKKKAGKKASEQGDRDTKETDHSQQRIILLFTPDQTMLAPCQVSDARFRKKHDTEGCFLDPHNADNIQVIMARPLEDGVHWIMNAVTAHTAEIGEHRKEFDYLLRHGKNESASGAVTYRVRSLSQEEIENNPKLKEKLEPGESYSIIEWRTAEGKSMPFVNPDEDFTAWTERLLRLSTTQTLVKSSDVMPMLLEDFLVCAKLVAQDYDPDRVGLISPDRASRLRPYEPKMYKRYRREAAGMVKGSVGRGLLLFEAQVLSIPGAEVLKRATTTAASAAWRAISRRKATVAVGGIFGPVVSFFLPALRRRFFRNVILTDAEKARNLAFEYTKPGHLGSNQQGFIGPLDMERCDTTLLLKPGDELPGLGPVNEPLRYEDWQQSERDAAARSILDVLSAREGTKIESRKINEMCILHIVQQDGITIYRLLNEPIAYAYYDQDKVHPQAPPIQEHVRDLFSETNFIRVEWSEEENRADFINLTDSEWIAFLNEETQEPEGPLLPVFEPGRGGAGYREALAAIEPRTLTAKEKVYTKCLHTRLWAWGAVSWTLGKTFAAAANDNEREAGSDANLETTIRTSQAHTDAEVEDGEGALSGSVAMLRGIMNQAGALGGRAEVALAGLQVVGEKKCPQMMQWGRQRLENTEARMKQIERELQNYEPEPEYLILEEQMRHTEEVPRGPQQG